jgi:hypothetical protein
MKIIPAVIIRNMQRMNGAVGAHVKVHVAMMESKKAI